ncbi:multidrug efflux MFS transporter [Bifidobacterium amazonense]|uniref:Multidrug efflux MFS transporter n=1 Tax=Bifidobacterium amazonense TaxID=2809027 RepID=A0ABS9VY19_9BIFI|nr:MDR family MFS transporter [Bifidobacterium amazonense]MCH9276998.1 multidrug efflux MFS transporter [Bifidobacterium amazonense]
MAKRNGKRDNRGNRGASDLRKAGWKANGTAAGSKALSRALSHEESFVDGHLTHAAFASIAILTFITFVGNFTQLQLSAALPTIVSEFGISVTTGQWLTSIFQLVMGVMVPLTAFLTRRFSTRQIVITSMIVFTLGSALAWVGSSFLMVLAGRLLEAVGTGVMWPVLQITVFSIYPLSRRGAAMGTVGVAMSVAPAIGPTLGGIQTDANGWRSIFLTLTVIGVVSLLLAVFGLRNFGTNDPDARADFFSVGLSVIGFGGLMFGFTNIESYPFTHPMVWLAMLVGLVGIVWFVTRQVRGARRYAADMAALTASEDSLAGASVAASTTASPTQPTRQAQHRPQPPLLDLGVLKNRSFTIGTICAALSFFAFSSIMVIMPLYIQDDRGYSATISGLVMMPGAFGMCISQYFGGKLLDRLGARPVALSGTIVLLFGTIMMSLIDLHTWIWWVSIWQFVRQIGMGFIIMPITTWSLNCLEPDEVSAGSAVTNTVRQIAGAIGAPVLVILMETLTRLHGGNHILASIFGTQWTLRMSAFLVFVQMVIVLFGVKGDGAGSSHEAAQKAVAHLREARTVRITAHQQ